MSTAPAANLAHAELFGLRLDNTTLGLAAADLIGAALTGSTLNVAFVNAHCVNVASRDADYSGALARADRLFVDGIGMRLAARLAGHRLRDNVNGTDLFPLICAHAARSGVKLAFLGAKPGVVDRCAAAMQARYAGLQVVWRQHGYFGADEEPAILESLAASEADVLFVAMGVPRQELWLEANRERLATPVRLSVGALFDFYSGDVPRAPAMWRRLGMEWLYRLAIEPRRLFRRYVLGNPEFLARTLWRRLRGVERLRRQPL